GGPLSPLLSNIMLDDLDKELERRGHKFVRYADDCNIYVQSKASGERVMVSVTEFLSKKLKLKVNAAKSAVDRPWNRKFLGYSMTADKKRPKLKVAEASVTRQRVKLKEFFHRARGWSHTKAIDLLTPVLRGWVTYYRMVDVKAVFEEMDGWIRRHLRGIRWRQWKRAKTRAENLIQLARIIHKFPFRKNNTA
ncbi:MAG: group II intron reverse transcriptase/maturase, partial [Pyrinomonadaceae bacterium]|nr:group II intron reverse transcriptase/maturase [Pyrinomonadaceae bacterium]